MDCSKTFTINTVDGCFTNDAALPAATAGVPYSDFLIPAFDPDPGFHFVYTVISGTLMTGLDLNISTGEISGTPTGGISAFCVELTQEADDPPFDCMGVTSDPALLVWTGDISGNTFSSASFGSGGQFQTQLCNPSASDVMLRVHFAISYLVLVGTVELLWWNGAIFQTIWVADDTNTAPTTLDFDIFVPANSIATALFGAGVSDPPNSLSATMTGTLV